MFDYRHDAPNIERAELSVHGRAINIQRATRPVPLFSRFLHDELRRVGGKLIHDHIDANSGADFGYVCLNFINRNVKWNGRDWIARSTTQNCQLRYNRKRRLRRWPIPLKSKQKQLRSFCSIFDNNLQVRLVSSCNFTKKMGSFLFCRYRYVLIHTP